MLKKLTAITLALSLSVSAWATDINALTQKAQTGNAQAQVELANHYYDEENYHKAVEWYSKAANRGDAEAQRYLGYVHYKGHGVRQNHQKAHEWFVRAADQGNASAQFNLGVMYLNDNSVRQNKTTAKEWFGKACDNGLQQGCDEYRTLNEQGY